MDADQWNNSSALFKPPAYGTGRQVFLEDVVTDLHSFGLQFTQDLLLIISDYVLDNTVLKCVVSGLGVKQTFFQVELTTVVTTPKFRLFEYHVGEIDTHTWEQKIPDHTYLPAEVELTYDNPTTNTRTLIPTDSQIGAVLHQQGVQWHQVMFTDVVRIKRSNPHKVLLPPFDIVRDPTQRPLFFLDHFESEYRARYKEERKEGQLEYLREKGRERQREMQIEIERESKRERETTKREREEERETDREREKDRLRSGRMTTRAMSKLKRIDGPNSMLKLKRYDTTTYTVFFY